EGFDDENSSDISLSTAELGIEASINEWVTGNLVFLYEEDETDFDIDEGFITIENGKKMPFYLKAGKMYVPFGQYQSEMISDPLTLEIGETNETAVLAGFASNGFDLNLYAFKGDTMESADDERVTHFGASVTYAREFENGSIDVGAGYLSSLMDSGGLSNSLAERETGIRETGGSADANLLQEAQFVGGFSVYGILSAGPVTVIAEYVGAVEEYESDYTDAGGAEATIAFQPEAYGLEVDYAFTVLEKDAFVGAAYQRTDEMGGILPETRYLACVGAEIFSSTVLSLEYAHDEDYDAADGGTGESADRVTAKLAIEF
ncbi:MAG: LbtU family siderophore porin, partial [Desulfobacterales bacterium]